VEYVPKSSSRGVPFALHNRRRPSERRFGYVLRGAWKGWKGGRKEGRDERIARELRAQQEGEGEVSSKREWFMASQNDPRGSRTLKEIQEDPKCSKIYAQMLMKMTSLHISRRDLSNDARIASKPHDVTHGR
jgi:hypothetical protein